MVGVSIDGGMASGTQDVRAQATANAQSGQPNAVSVPIEKVDPSVLWDAWQRYMVKIKETNGQLYGSMGVGPQISADGVTVEVRIASQFEVDNIEKNSDLLLFLKQATKNNHLTLKAVIDPKIAKEREVIYTATQKLDKMIAKNPVLHDFMQNLGLTLG